MMRIILYAGLGALVGFFAGGFLGVSVFWEVSDSAVSITAFLSSVALGIIGSFIGRILNKRDAQKQIQNEPGVSAPPSWASAFLNAYSILIMIIAVFPFAFILGAAVIGVTAGKSMDYSLLPQSLMFLAVMFGSMVLAWGIWNRKKWVIPALALWVINSLAMIMWSGIDDVREFIMPLLTVGIFALSYRYRASFSGSFLHYILQGAFLVSLIFSWIVFLNPSLIARKTDAQNQNTSGAAESAEELRDFREEGPGGFSLQYPAYFSAQEGRYIFMRKDTDGNYALETIAIQRLNDGPLDATIHYMDEADAFGFQYSERAKSWNSVPYDKELTRLAPSPYTSPYRTKHSLDAYVFQSSDSVWQMDKAYVEHPSRRSVLIISVARNLEENPLSDRNTIFHILDSLQFGADPVKPASIRDISIYRYASHLRLLEPRLEHRVNEPVYYGDFDGDGSEEAAFTIYKGGTGGSDGPYVLKLRDDGSVVNLKMDEASTLLEPQGHEGFRVFQNRLIKFFPLYRKDDPNCCPTGGIRYILLKWNKEKSRFIAEKIADLEHEWYEKTQKSEGGAGWDEAINEAIKRLGL